MYGAVEILRKMLRILWKETKINAEVKAIRKRQKKFIGVFNGRDGIEKLASCRHIQGQSSRGRWRKIYVGIVNSCSLTTNNILSNTDFIQISGVREVGDWLSS